MNVLNTNEGIQIVRQDGKTYDLPKGSVYTRFTAPDTIDFILTTDYNVERGITLLSTRANNLKVNGQIYTFEQLRDGHALDGLYPEGGGGDIQLKTINGESLKGTGNIVIEGGEAHSLKPIVDGSGLGENELAVVGGEGSFTSPKPNGTYRFSINSENPIATYRTPDGEEHGSVSYDVYEEKVTIDCWDDNTEYLWNGQSLMGLFAPRNCFFTVSDGYLYVGHANGDDEWYFDGESKEIVDEMPLLIDAKVMLGQKQVYPLKLKTINGEEIAGEGNIEIQGGSSAPKQFVSWDGSDRPMTFKLRKLGASEFMNGAKYFVAFRPDNTTSNVFVLIEDDEIKFIANDRGNETLIFSTGWWDEFSGDDNRLIYEGSIGYANTKIYVTDEGDWLSFKVDSSSRYYSANLYTPMPSVSSLNGAYGDVKFPKINDKDPILMALEKKDIHTSFKIGIKQDGSVKETKGDINQAIADTKPILLYCNDGTGSLKYAMGPVTVTPSADNYILNLTADITLNNVPYVWKGRMRYDGSQVSMVNMTPKAFASTKTLTSDEYDSLAVKDPYTLYLITD